LQKEQEALVCPLALPQNFYWKNFRSDKCVMSYAPSMVHKHRAAAYRVSILLSHFHHTWMCRNSWWRIFIANASRMGLLIWNAPDNDRLEFQYLWIQNGEWLFWHGD